MMFELTPISAAVLLAGLAIPLSLAIRRDAGEFEAFKRAADSRERCRYFRRWTLSSALLFIGSALAILLLTGRSAALTTLPAEFTALAASLSARRPDLTGLLGGVLGGVVLGLAILAAGVRIGRRRRAAAAPSRAAETLQALLPRNRTEALWATLISVNAGVGEELFFRLLLPLLLSSVTGNALAAFIIAGLLFGVMHVYQGLAGALAVTLLGALMTLVYLWSEQLWLAMLLHALIDLRALLLAPAMSALLQRWRAKRVTG